MSSNDYGEPKTAQHRRAAQPVLNESWPLSDKAGEHARGIEDQPDPIDVEVRVEWADDGEECLPGRAHRWTAPHVFGRSRTRGREGLYCVDRARDARRFGVPIVARLSRLILCRVSWQPLLESCRSGSDAP